MVMKTIALSLLLALSVHASAQDDIPLRKTLNMVGEDLNRSAAFSEASMFLYYTGGLILAVGFDKESDMAKLGGASLIIGGMITTTISIGQKRSAARLLKEL